MNNNVLYFLSLCRKAQKLKMGFDSVEKTLPDCCLLIFSKDVSERTREKMMKKAAEVKAPCIDLPFTKDDIYLIVGKPVSVLSITDDGLAKAFLSKI